MLSGVTMTFRDLVAKVEALGLMDEEIGELHVTRDDDDQPDAWLEIEIFKNATGRLTIANSCCS